MRGKLLGCVFVIFVVFPFKAFGYGKMINVNIGGNGAYPLGTELTKYKYKVDIVGGKEVCTYCNPVFFGAGGSVGVDVMFPFYLGIGAQLYMNSFLRKEKPEPNDFDKKPFNNYQGFLVINFRILDIIPSYNKKWGTLIIHVSPGAGSLYREAHIAFKTGLAYLYPVVDFFQIGAGFDFVYQHPFAGDYDDDMYLAFGLRMSFGFLEWKKKEKQPGEIEEQMGAMVTEEMKKKDTDGDGLNDYCELMLGTNPKNKDTDGDGLFDSEEDANKNCVRDEGETDPIVADTDGGGASDGWERKSNYDPLNPDDDDRDQDFIPDDKDACPGTQPGVGVNERGCPTLIEATVLEGVEFPKGKAELTEEATTVLDNWVKVLMDNPQLQFKIVGYTDNRGNKKRLRKLSKERAKAVYDYFSSKGISESRMSFEGKGPANPIESNATAAGRKKNNRIEIVPIFEE